MSNKFTAWSGNVPKIKIESNASKTNSLGDHPSTSTYGWSVTTMSQATLYNTAFVG